MKRVGPGHFLWLAILAGVWGCGSVPQNRLVPVMGVGEGAAPSPKASSAAPRPVAAARPAVADSDSSLRQILLVLPFRDLTKHRGIWDLPSELPRGLVDTLSSRDFLRLVPLDSALARLTPKERRGNVSAGRGLELGRALGADYVVFGQIDRLTMERFQATVPIGGYRSYVGVTGITLHLVRVIDGQAAGEVAREADEDTRRYGITNPASYVPYEKEYYLLGQVEWGSGAFRETLLGKSVATCLSGLAAGVDSLVHPSPRLRASSARIVDVEGPRAYINVGAADSVANGDKYGVWDRGRPLTDPQSGVVLGQSLPRRVGVVQVEQVLSDHLSMVRVLEGQEAVLPDYVIRAE